jgi:hypothetical protein
LRHHLRRFPGRRGQLQKEVDRSADVERRVDDRLNRRRNADGESHAR